MPFGCGYPELHAGFAGCNNLRGIKYREVFPDDFFSGVSFDALRPAVPTRHAAFGVEGKDRVVLHSLHQEMESLFGLLLGDFRLLVHSDIPKQNGERRWGGIMRNDAVDTGREPALGSVQIK